MSYSFADGARFYLGTTLASPINVTGISNGTPAEITTATSSYTLNDEVLLISGWEDLTDSVFKPSAVTTTKLTLGGSVPIDTTDTNFYPPGSSAGTVQKITTWTEIGQVLNITSSGGDPRMVNIEPLSRRNAIQVPVGFNPQSLQLDIGYDPTLAGYQALVGAARTLAKRPFKFLLAGGQTGYGYGYVSVSELPRLQKGQANQVSASLALLGKFIGYQ